MANAVKLKRSAVSGKIPLASDLDLGELAINTYDGKVFLKKNDGTDSIVEVGTSPSSLNTSQITGVNRLILSATSAGAINLAAGSSGVNISNGTMLTAVTRGITGSGYTSFPTVIVAAPTSSGGTQAVVVVATMAQWGITPTIITPGTGYSVGNILTIVGGTPNTSAGTLTVTAVTAGAITGASYLTYAAYVALPASTFSVTGGTGSGATFSSTWYPNTYTITTSGSGYVEQPTVTISGGGGSGAIAYATVGGAATIRALGGITSQAIDFATPGGSQLRLQDVGDGSRPLTINGGSAGGFTSAGIGAVIGTLQFSTNASSHSFYTGGRGATEQFRVSSTTSAVNYIQVTGGATNSGPFITVQGSDVNIPLSLASKNIASVDLITNSAKQFDVFGGSNSVNWIRASGNSLGNGPYFQPLGVDANINMALYTKGTGVIKLGTGNGVTQFQVNDTISAVNYVQATGGTTGNPPSISVQGSDANIALALNSKGSGGFLFTKTRDVTTSSLYLFQFSGGLTNDANGGAFWRGLHTGGPVFTVSGVNKFPRIAEYFEVDSLTDPTVKNVYTAIGNNTDTFEHNFSNETGGGWTFRRAVNSGLDKSFKIATPALTDRNYLQVTGAAVGATPVLSSQGTDTNVSLTLQSKGTGGVNLAAGSSGVNISNGTTVTAITRTAGGLSYTSNPTITLAAPTTAGGVQATVSATFNAYSIPITSGGTGYIVGDTLTLQGGTYTDQLQLTVSSVSAGVITAVTALTLSFGIYSVIPTNPCAATGGTGSGATLSPTWTLRSLSITNAGSGYVEQPTVTISGGGGSGATAYATVGAATAVDSIGPVLSFYTPGGESLRLVDPGFNTTPWVLTSGLSGSFSSTAKSLVPYIGDTTTNGVTFATGMGTGTGIGSAQFKVAHTTNAVNYLQVTGSATGSEPAISILGSDSVKSLRIASKGTSFVYLQNNNSVSHFSAGGTASAVNYINARGAIAGSAPSLEAVGTDTNINLNLTPKGTGKVQQNGSDLALGTHKYHAFSVGSYYFDSYNQDNYLRLFTQNATSDTVRYKTVSSPEYYDYTTSTWAAWTVGQSGIQQLLDGNSTFGIDVPHANRTFRFKVSGVDGYPTNALVLLQSTWSAVAYTTATVTIASSTTLAGVYTTRQVMVFSPANSGNNWGMHAFYTSALHTGDTHYQITIDITDWVDSTTYVTYPLRNLSILSNYSNAGGIVPYSTAYDKFSTFIGGIRTAPDTNGTLDIGRYSSSNPSAIVDTGATATSIVFRTQYVTQMAMAHTASAVNFVQVTGGTTGNSPVISAQGSDVNQGLNLLAKGTGAINCQSWVNMASASANWLRAEGAASTFSPKFTAQGSDTNIDLGLTTKGTGALVVTTGSGKQLQVNDATTTGPYTLFSRDSVNNIQFIGAVGTANLGIYATGGGNIRFFTASNNTQEQFRIVETSSAVNFVQVTGGTTSAGASSLGGLLYTGSDTSTSMAISVKGTGYIAFAGSGSTSNQALRVNLVSASNIGNLIQVSGSAAGAAPVISAISGSSGTDANIDLTLTPKGTGSVVASGPVKLPGYTVATLPTAGIMGRTAYVTDATTPTYLGVLTGGGTIKVPVFDNGTAWVSH